MNNYKLETIAFLCGGLIMILELTGSRVLSPYFGNSIYIWTGMIGIILGFLSLGYYYGGILADKGTSFVKLSSVLWYAGISTFLIATFKEPILQFFATITSGDIKSGSILSIIFLFGPVSILLGYVTPIIIKLKLDNLSRIGKDVGKIYALSTMGSITGTFLSGYFLIPQFGNTNLIYMVALLIFILSFWIHPKLSFNQLVTIMMLGLLYYLNVYSGWFRVDVIADIDTTYNRVIVRDTILDQKRARVLMTDRLGIQSAIYVDDNDELATEYTRSFANITKILPKPKDSLTIGGAGMAFPKHFILKNLGENMDVIEIDPAMINIAKKYFNHYEIDKLHVYSGDARNYVQETKKTYNLIYLDAFNSLAPPHHLTTKEFFQNLSMIIQSEGVLLVNMVSSISGRNSELLSWQYSTLKTVFETVEVFKINNNKQSNQTQNLILIASNNKDFKTDKTKLPTNITLLDSTHYFSDKKILTDDYAPVEHLAGGYMGSN